MRPTLKSGYTKLIVKSNIALMAQSGYDKNTAIRDAFNAARASFFKTRPKALLPEWLAYPSTNRTFNFYLPNGSPLRKEDKVSRNPVKQLPIDDDELDDIQRNIQKQLTGQGAQVRRAAELYTAFTGHEDVELTKFSIPPLPKVGVAIGQVDGILYSTVRDNVSEKYVHKFKKKSRPLLVSSQDGKHLYLIGGSYNFTDRGIVDE